MFKLFKLKMKVKHELKSLILFLGLVHILLYALDIV
jgi:hypothetical protein